MRFLSTNEAWPLIATKPFKRNLRDGPAPTWADGQDRVDCGPPADIDQFLYFAHDVIRWLPPDADRLFWLTDWRSGIPQPYAAFQAMRVGLGALSEIRETPACLFPGQSWTHDTFEAAPEDRHAAEALLGMLSIALLADWKGWLFSTATDDTIEIWERNVFFISKRTDRRTEATEIVSRYKASS